MLGMGSHSKPICYNGTESASLSSALMSHVPLSLSQGAVIMVQTTQKRRSRSHSRVSPDSEAVLLAAGQLLLFLCYQFC